MKRYPSVVKGATNYNLVATEQAIATNQKPVSIPANELTAWGLLVITAWLTLNKAMPALWRLFLVDKTADERRTDQLILWQKENSDKLALSLQRLTNIQASILKSLETNNRLMRYLIQSSKGGRKG